MKARIKEFFYQSFRPRNAEDYKKLFKKSGTAVYPWFYLRVFAVLTIVFVLYAVINATMPGAGDWETFYFVGGAFMDFALLALLYELYPYDDLSVFKLAAVCVIGGSFADLISAFMYHFHSHDTLLNGWKLAAIAGVGEEIAKAIPAIVCILVLKKKDNPLAGFLIGAAVGTWFSVTENASYIHTYPFYLSVLTAAGRAFGCMFSHAVWTALICWAFCKFRRPYINFKFYGVVLFCMAMHFCIDMPLWDYPAALVAEAAACGIATFIFGVWVIYSERAVKPEETKRVPFTKLHKANLTAVGFIAALCVLLIAFSAVFSTTSYKKTVYVTIDEFISYAQNGYAISPDREREFDENYENYFACYRDGELVAARQRVPAKDFIYEYRYSLTEEEDEKKMSFTSVAVVTEADGEETFYEPVLLGDDVLYYNINPELENCGVSVKDGKVIVKKYFDRLSVPTIVLLGLISATAVCGTAEYIIKRRTV